jgi:hypothetical protein
MHEPATPFLDAAELSRFLKGKHRAGSDWSGANESDNIL